MFNEVLDMVIKFAKKVRKQRGRRWHGWGGKKRHRGKGHQGGSGFSGFKKHKRSKIYAEHAYNYFGNHGFAMHTKKTSAVNIEQLQKIAEKSGSTNIDLSKLGFDKLLGRGEVNKPYHVSAKAASKSAIEKIEAAGGKVVTESE